MTGDMRGWEGVDKTWKQAGGRVGAGGDRNGRGEDGRHGQGRRGRGEAAGQGWGRGCKGRAGEGGLGGAERVEREG